MEIEYDDLLKLRQLTAIVQCGSFSAAARELGISHPGSPRICARSSGWGIQILE